MLNLLFSMRVTKALLLQGKRIIRQHIFTQKWQQRGVYISNNAIINLGPLSYLEIGKGSSIGPYTILDLTNDPNQPTDMDIVESKLIIGKRTVINEFNNIRAAGGSIQIGNDCLISQFVSIIASNHSIDGPGLIRESAWKREKNCVVIGDDVWIGTHGLILPGVTIGIGSVIAAGSVVTHDVPERAIVAGIPAQIKRFRS